MHKVHRWSVTLQERYPNALLYAVPSAANISDWLSRNFEVPDKEKGNVNALYQSVGRQASLEGNWVSTSEMREKVERLPSPQNTKVDSEIIPGDKEKEDMFQHAVSTRQTKREDKSERVDRLNEVWEPLQVLKDQLSTLIICKAQRKS